MVVVPKPMCTNTQLQIKGELHSKVTLNSIRPRGGSAPLGVFR